GRRPHQAAPGHARGRRPRAGMGTIHRLRTRRDPMSIKNTATVISLAFFLGACATPDADKPAPTPEAAPAPKPGAVTTPGGGQNPGPGTNLQSRGANPADALKDPSNILSKRSVFFDLDKYDIKAEYKGLVEAHAKYLRDNPGAKMLIQGNADERGSR